MTLAGGQHHLSAKELCQINLQSDISSMFKNMASDDEHPGTLVDYDDEQVVKYLNHKSLASRAAIARANKKLVQSPLLLQTAGYVFVSDSATGRYALKNMLSQREGKYLFIIDDLGRLCISHEFPKSEFHGGGFLAKHISLYNQLLRASPGSSYIDIRWAGEISVLKRHENEIDNLRLNDGSGLFHIKFDTILNAEANRHSEKYPLNYDEIVANAKAKAYALSDQHKEWGLRALAEFDLYIDDSQITTVDPVSEKDGKHGKDMTFAKFVIWCQRNKSCQNIYRYYDSQINLLQDAEQFDLAIFKEKLINLYSQRVAKQSSTNLIQDMDEFYEDIQVYITLASREIYDFLFLYYAAAYQNADGNEERLSGNAMLRVPTKLIRGRRTLERDMEVKALFRMQQL